MVQTPTRIAIAVLALVAVATGGVAAHASATPGGHWAAAGAAGVAETGEMTGVSDAQIVAGPAGMQANEERAVDEEDGEEDEEEKAEEEGVGPLGDWWGLGGEVNEAPYVGLVELGAALLVVGVGGYAGGKRTDAMPTRWRRHLLPAHEWTMLAGVVLTVPHFLAVEEWEGLGLLVALLLGVEVASGVYGRHLHRHVVRLDRGEEPAPLVGRIVKTTRAAVFSHWRVAHVLLTAATFATLVAHVLTATGGD